MAEPAPDPLDLLREICLGLPEVPEKPSHGTPTFWVGGKTFAQYEDHLHGDTRVGVWLMAEGGAQEILVGGDPATFYRPPYVGYLGWVGINLGGHVDWDQVSILVEAAYRVRAPKRLAGLLDPALD
ncbi:MAG: MmcQ/YjbR family DNA-binding protein [Dehalococcoidia bacterium]